jgi:hypothetical protein
MSLEITVLVLIYKLQVLRDLDQTVMVGKFDDEDNTLGHIAALTGNSKLFKVWQTF